MSFFKLFELEELEIEGKIVSASSWNDGERAVRFYERNINNPVKLTKNYQSVPEKYKLVIELILQLDKFWEVKSNMLHIFGFPHSRDELRKLI
jgi:hypothetical protein